MYFGLLLASGVFFVFIAFTLFLPVIVLVPQKFALCFTAGCGFIIGSFFALKGPVNQFNHMTSKEVCHITSSNKLFYYLPRVASSLIFSSSCFLYQRLPFTLGFIGSMMGTIYVSMVLHSYILSVLFSVLQVSRLYFFFSFTSILQYVLGVRFYIFIRSLTMRKKNISSIYLIPESCCGCRLWH